jgi:cyclomaltodextrinase / maltogenic alpha-amylase / neopullulanase
VTEPTPGDAPAWLDTAVVYGVIPRLFGERPFAAVTERLPYLRELGVNALWLSPVTTPAEGDFGYAVVDYLTPNPAFGTRDELRELVSDAHDLGIRVLIDFVPNHSSDEHPFFRDAQARGRSSPYRDWYDRDESGAYTYYFDWTNLPNFNFGNADVRRYVTNAFAHWVRTYDVDGFRVDACWGVRQRYPAYWPAWRQEMKDLKADMLLLAEASARDPWYYAHGFDAGYDWTDQLGRWAWEHVFDDPSQVAERLDAAIAADPQPSRVFRFLNNNDTGPRFVTTHGARMTRVAAALLLTLPGIPCVFTGDEIGAQYEPYASPPPVDWQQDDGGLRDWYTRLCGLRTSRPSLHSRHWTRLPLPHGELYAYLRHDAGGADPLLVLLNFGREAREAVLNVPPFPPDGELADILNDGRVPVVGGQIAIGPQSAMILAPERGAA